jgi:hypothetical protein
MEAMGKLDICIPNKIWPSCAGIEESDEEEDGATGSGEFDSDWAPHGSKSVSGAHSD